MVRKLAGVLVGILLVIALAPSTGAQRNRPYRPDPDGWPGEAQSAARLRLERAPAGATTSLTSWSDSFQDDSGLTWMENATVLGDDVRLSQITALGAVEEGGDILAMTETANGKIYLGTDGAYLNVYDAGSGTMTSLGAPVPEECFG